MKNKFAPQKLHAIIQAAVELDETSWDPTEVIKDWGIFFFSIAKEKQVPIKFHFILKWRLIKKRERIQKNAFYQTCQLEWRNKASGQKVDWNPLVDRKIWLAQSFSFVIIA